MRRKMVTILVALLLLWSSCSLAGSASPPTLDASSLSALRIYAYRDWQSVGVYVNPGDLVQIRARGEWYYTPKEWHGPGGHPRYRSPAFYPLPNVPGGALIGKIGETSQPFYVGANLTIPAAAAGWLYLRIDDDILSDNEGEIEVQVTIKKPPAK